MNPIKYILARILRTVFTKIKPNTFRGNYVHLMVTGGLIGLSTFLWYDNDAFPGTIGKAITSVTHMYSNGKNVNKNFLAGITQKCIPSVVTIEIKNSEKIDAETGGPVNVSLGSGFVVKQNGWILTNAHNIINKADNSINVITNDGQSYKAVIQDVDILLDLALLKIDCDHLTPIAFGNSKDVCPGEWVVALGSPASLKNSVTAGVVSSLDRDAKELGIKNLSVKYIQTDAAMTSEHSGGPLINLNGQVIGVNNLKVTAGIAFAIPIDYVKDFLMKNILKFEEKNKDVESSNNNSRFGITTIPTTPEILIKMLNEQNVKVPEKFGGVLVWNIIKDSPAHKAGIFAGDIITHVNQKPVSCITDLYSKLFWESKGLVIITLFRRGKQKNIKLYLKE